MVTEQLSQVRLGQVHCHIAVQVSQQLKYGELESFPDTIPRINGRMRDETEDGPSQKYPIK